MKKTIIGVATAVAAAIALAGCGTEVGEEKTGQKVTSTAEEQPAQEDVPQARQDVTLKSCKIGDPYDMGESVVIADVEIKNSAAKVSDFFYSIEATKPDGSRIETLYGSALDVSPGQTVDTGQGDGEEDVSGSEDVSGAVTCQVVSVDRWPSTE